MGVVARGRAGKMMRGRFLPEEERTMSQPTQTPGAAGAAPVSAPAPAALPSIPDDVREFARNKGVSAYLPELLELMGRLLPGRPVALTLDWDPEIPDWGCITFRANGEDLSVGEWLTIYRAWQTGVAAICDGDKVQHFSFGV
jgi:hypothetical protein